MVEIYPTTTESNTQNLCNSLLSISLKIEQSHNQLQMENEDIRTYTIIKCIKNQELTEQLKQQNYKCSQLQSHVDECKQIIARKNEEISKVNGKPHCTIQRLEFDSKSEVSY